MTQPPQPEKSLTDNCRRKTLSARQRQTLDALVASLNLNLGQRIPDDHPLKAFLDASDQNMTVKEALAMTFSDYRVRLNNKRPAPADSPVKRKKPRFARGLQKAADVGRSGGQLAINLERVEPSGSAIKCKNNLNPPVDIAFSFVSGGELNRIQELAMVIKAASFDMTIDVLAGDFGVSRRAVNKVLAAKQCILQNTARVLIECVLEDTISGRKDENTASKRRGPFFGLNILVWKLFEECSHRGIQLSPKLIRDYALLMSRQLGLTNFKGSDGWYDAFKKRHKITWSPMRGISSISEEDREDLVVEMEELRKRLNGDEDDQIKMERLGEVGGNPRVNLEFPEAEEAVNIVKKEVEEEEEEEIDLPAISDAQANAAMIVRSASIYIPDPEVSYYISILRNCIVSRNPGLLPQLVQIQELIVQIMDGIAPHVRHNNANLAPRQQNQANAAARGPSRQE